MQKWFSSRPKGVRILLWWMTGTAAVFLLAVLGFSIAAWEWFPAAPLFIIVWIWPLALSLLLCMQFAVWCLEIRHGRIPGESAAVQPYMKRYCTMQSAGTVPIILMVPLSRRKHSGCGYTFFRTTAILMKTDGN